MTNELTRLFSKSFVIGHALPAAAFLLAIVGILLRLDINIPYFEMAQAKDLEAIYAAAVFFVVWLTALSLFALNTPIIKILEGYGWLNPFRLKVGPLKSEYRKLAARIADGRNARAQAEKEGRPFDGEALSSYVDASWRMARDFPDNEVWVLPTRFGNTVRAFEVYSHVVYGIDSIYGWGRLYAVIPPDYREMIDSEKARMDFWINIWFTSCLIAIIYCALAAARQHFASWWIVVVAIVVAFTSARTSCAVARSWGTYINSAFDLYRGDMCRKLGYQLPPTLEQERELWQGLSQVWVYRSKEAAERLNKFRLPGAGVDK